MTRIHNFIGVEGQIVKIGADDNLPDQIELVYDVAVEGDRELQQQLDVLTELVAQLGGPEAAARLAQYLNK
jgi:hypothetical protein